MTQYTIANRVEASIIAYEADALMDNMADDGLEFPYNLELSSAEAWQFEVAKEQAMDCIGHDNYKIAVALNLPVKEAERIAIKILEIGLWSDANSVLGYLVTRD